MGRCTRAVSASVYSISPVAHSIQPFDRLLNDNAFTRLPMRTRAATRVRRDSRIDGFRGPAQTGFAMSFSAVHLPAYKAIGQVVLTDETVLSVTPAADKRFESQLQQMVALASDTKFLEIITEGTGVASQSEHRTTASPSCTT